MNFSINFTKNAERELDDIVYYISWFSLTIARKFIYDINNFISENIWFMPYMFRLYKDKIRFCPYWNYLIFYEIIEKKKKVDILHIVHWARDLSNLNF